MPQDSRSKITEISRRAYFGDTDAGGVVHHAAYVHWFEQARTEWIHERGGDVSLWEQNNVIFVVAAMEMRYLKPVRLDQEVSVTAQLEEQRACQVTFAQKALVEGSVACSAKVRLVCVRLDTGRPARIPVALLASWSDVP